jgi:hypothetical protein
MNVLVTVTPLINSSVGSFDSPNAICTTFHIAVNLLRCCLGSALCSSCVCIGAVSQKLDEAAGTPSTFVPSWVP